jgi:L-iditol 2-dehydrogenase
MQSIALTGIRSMQATDVPEPAIGADHDVLLQVGIVGVCGSDVHYYTTGRIGSQVVQVPFRVGHEFSATVLDVGRAVSRVKVGDRVAVDPAMPCHACDQCRANRSHTCRKLRFLGCPGQAEGCLCERIRMPEACCFPLRHDTSLESAALIEPLSIGVYAVRMAQLPPRARIGILGAGPIGRCVLAVARRHGVNSVFMTDRVDARLDAARRAGADWTGNPDTCDVVAGILAREPMQLDCVFECCGQQDALDQAVCLLKPGGRLVLVGIPEVDRVSFSIDELRRREIAIVNIRRQNECMQPALDLIERGGLSLADLVTHSFPLARASEAFDLVSRYADGVLKAMIRVG